MKNIILPLIVVSLFLLTACSPGMPPEPAEVKVPEGVVKDSCTTDDDCVCGGIDKANGNCFLGNREYYDRYVDKLSDCPDFCAGIAGNLVVRCIDSTCMQVFECLTGADCGSGRCENNRCVSQ